MKCASFIPPFSDLSPSLVSFVGQNLKTPEDLLNSSVIVSELEEHCLVLDQKIGDLNQRLSISIEAYAVHSKRVRGAVDRIRDELNDLRSATEVPLTFSDAKRGEGSGRHESVVAELAALANEVARVESVRTYAVTTLKLGTLIGAVEDAASFCRTGSSKPPSLPYLEEPHQLAIKSLQQIEEILTYVTQRHPKWSHLISSVDQRVDQALAVLRPQLIMGHRSLLTSLGWPPSLSTSTKYSSYKAMNPLFSMHGSLKEQYRASFLSLCYLQKIQKHRKLRHVAWFNQEVSLHQPLWAIEELARPIAFAAEKFFLKWRDKPELIFALVYKIVRDFVGSMDEVLQPMIDQARLVGCSCSEEWISAMVASLTTFLLKEVFPVHLASIDEDNGDTVSSKVSWLHLLDLMISFDKKIQSFISSLGILNTSRDEDSLQRISSLSVFCIQPDWLNTWAQIELNDLLEKLRQEMSDESNWMSNFHGSEPDESKCPTIASLVIRHLSAVVDRCSGLPFLSLRARFVKFVGVPIVHEFLNCLYGRCQEADGLTALVDDTALVMVASSINAARHLESALDEWCDDVFFLEIGTDDTHRDTDGGYLLREEIERLKDFRTEWTGKISFTVLRGFDSASSEYLKDTKQWKKKEQECTLSKGFVGGLYYLQGKVSKMEISLNEIDFTSFWRNLASRIDHLIFDGILVGNVKFSVAGVERLGEDITALVGVFGAWCLRPQGFFPKVSEGLKLLKMQTGHEGSKREKKGWWRDYGISHLSQVEVEKVMKNRCFAD